MSKITLCTGPSGEGGAKLEPLTRVELKLSLHSALCMQGETLLSPTVLRSTGFETPVEGESGMLRGVWPRGWVVTVSLASCHGPWPIGHTAGGVGQTDTSSVGSRHGPN
jgi:hypothetical protein